MEQAGFVPSLLSVKDRVIQHGWDMADRALPSILVMSRAGSGVPHIKSGSSRRKGLTAPLAD